MRNWTLYILLVAVLGIIAFRGNTQVVNSSVDNSPILLDFGDHGTVTKAAFEAVYLKNNGGLDSVKHHTALQYKAYLGQYIDFYRKVLEAESKGIQETQDFKLEYESYRRQLAKPFLVDHDVQEALILEAYERSKWLISCSHLLVAVGPSASPDDTLQAYKKAQNYLDSMLNGSDFSEMATRHSDDPSAKENAGYLGYFSVLEMVYPFETGAYNTAIDKISIVRSDFGYHLIKVHNKLKNEGKKTAAHIIVRVGSKFNERETSAAAARIEEIYQKLKNGADFSQTAKDYSDDPATASRGGDLGNGRLLPMMEEVRRSLPLDKFSVPFQTEFGWHILKVTGIDSLPSLEDARADLVARISRDARSYRGQEHLINSVKKQNGFKFYSEAEEKFNSFVKDLDDYKSGRWRPTERVENGLQKHLLFEIGVGDWHLSRTLKDYYDYYFRYRKLVPGISIEAVTASFMKQFIEDEIIAFQEAHLHELFPEFAAQMKEYRDGILLFTLTEENVWKKSTEDRAGLRSYFDRHRENFKADKRVIVREYQSAKREVLLDVERMLTYRKTPNEIDSIINAFSPTNLKIETVTYEEAQSSVADDLIDKSVGYQSPITAVEQGYVIRVIDKVLPPQLLTFEEAKSEATAGYQTYLEEWWLIELETKYPVIIDESVLLTLFK